MKILLVDGSNIVMRAAFGGDIEPAVAVKTATGLIQRAARQINASHLIVALDSPSGLPSWRKQIYPQYKANRTKDTSPWIREACETWTRDGWWVEESNGFEADDIIATLAARILAIREQTNQPTPSWKSTHDVIVLSGDSDLLPLLSQGAEILKPMNGGIFMPVVADEVCIKYSINVPALLVDLKAMTGETGDNVPGVAGIGAIRAAALLKNYKTLDGIIAAGSEDRCKHSKLVSSQSEMVNLSRQLVSLKTDATVMPVQPSKCRFN